MTEPKLIQVPGIPGNLREQSLDEFLAVLEPTHLARQQLNEIRNQALKSVELSTQLMQANEKVIELQQKLMAAVPPAPVGWPYTPDGNITVTPLPAHPSQAEAAKVIMQAQPNMETLNEEIINIQRSGPAPKAECPNCKKMVSTAGGPWASHQRNAHPDN